MIGAEAPSGRIRVVLCDDHQVLLDAMSTLLGALPDIDVVGTATTIGALILLVEAVRPDVVLLDQDLPDATGLSAVPQVVEMGSKVVMLTSFMDDAVVGTALHAGAKGFVQKHAGADAVAEAVRLVAAGHAAVAPDILAQALSGLSGRDRTGVSLTEREHELLSLLALGRSNIEIAEALHLSPNTVRNHLARIYVKLSAQSRLEAVAIAVREGLIRRT